jgi:predicted RNA-binding protein (virulence factor B family)
MMMDERIQLGKINTLKIDRITPPGIFVVAGDGEAVLLPNRYVEKSMKVDDEIDVFVTTDSEDRLVALRERPIAMVDEFGFFEVVNVESFGAFVDWGLPKDLFVPRKNQKTPFKVGQWRILRVIYDAQTDRLTGDERIMRYLSKDIGTLKEKDEVELLVLARTPLGYKVIVNSNFEGMLFTNEIFEEINVGDSKKGFIKTIREDGKLDITLRPIGEKRKDEAAEKVLSVLRKNGGKIDFTYKSDAEDIKAVFGLSKKSYKAALTKLIESDLIVLEDKLIREQQCQK